MKTKSLKAVFWLILSQIGTKSLSSIFSLLIASLLSPLIYGDFAAITIVYVFIQAITDACSNKIIIQKRHISEMLVKHICAVVCSINLFAVLFITVSTEIFVGQKSLFWVALIVGFSQILSSTSSIFVSVLQRKMLMKKIAQQNILVSLFGGLLCLFLAKLGFGIYALALQLFFGSFFSLVISANQSPIKFSMFPLCLNTRYILRIINISKIYVPVQLLSTLNRESLRIIVGLLLGPYSLGLITGAQKLITVVQSLVSSSINRAVFPIICELLRDKKDRFNVKYMRIISLSVSCITFSFLAAWIISGDIVILFLGSNWAPINPLLLPLFLSGWATSIGWLNNQTIFAISQEKKQLVFGFSRFVVGILYLLIASALGLLPMCYMGLFRSALIDPFHVKFLTSKINISFKKYFTSTLVSVVPGITSIVILHVFFIYINQPSPSIYTMTIKLICLIVIYWGTLFALNSDLKKEVLGIFQEIRLKNASIDS